MLHSNFDIFDLTYFMFVCINDFSDVLSSCEIYIKLNQRLKIMQPEFVKTKHELNEMVLHVAL